MPDPGFSDVDGTTHERAIDCVAWYEIARGANSRQYAPDVDVAHGQMASLIASLLGAGRVVLPSGPPDAFVDDDGSPARYGHSACWR